jgi:hypothetical protein
MRLMSCDRRLSHDSGMTLGVEVHEDDYSYNEVSVNS